jgi:hypothetical protein
MAKNQIEISPHGFGSLTQDEMRQMAVLLIKAGYVDVGITRNQPNKGKSYVYTLKARRSVQDRDEKDTDKDA